MTGEPQMPDFDQFWKDAWTHTVEELKKVTEKSDQKADDNTNHKS